MEWLRFTGQLILALALALVLFDHPRAVLAQASSPAGVGAKPAGSPSSENSTLPDERTLVPVKTAPSPSAPEKLPPVIPEFDTSGTKFSVDALMRTLRDSRHEGWVLAAYPDPKTGRPLIGAGFSLDVEAREHIQSDTVNPHTFLEPSSAQLWEAAGLDSARLQQILAQYDRNLKAWNKKKYRKRIKANKLPPDVTSLEATALLRVSSLQAIHNAKAYCRSFDQLTASQQMALTQLVFQMGVNLEEFIQFLGVLNNRVLNDAAGNNGTLNNGVSNSDNYASAQVAELTSESINDPIQHWKAVQQTLIESQWAKRYTTRAVSVIAMFDPTYAEDPKAAEHQVQAVLRPPAKHRHKKAHAASVQAANEQGGTLKSPQKTAAKSQ